MEKRTLIAVVLSIAVVMLWQSLFLPPPPPGDEATGPSVETVRPEDSIPPKPTPKPLAPEKTDALSSEEPEMRDSDLPRDERVVERDGAIAVFTTEGGGIKSWKLTDYTTYQEGEGPLEVFKNIMSSSPVLSKSTEPMDLLAGPFENALPFELSGLEFDKRRYRLVSFSEDKVVYERASSGLVVRKEYELETNRYRLMLTVSIENRRSDEITIEPSFGVRALHHGGGLRTFAPVPGPIYAADGSVERPDLDDAEDARLEFSGDIAWLGINDKYFLRAILPAAGESGSVVVYQEGEEESSKTFTTALEQGKVHLSPGESRSFQYELFLGPKQSEVLEAVGRDLEDSLDFGIFGPIAEGLLWFLKKLYSVVNSYGLAIILLTLTIKVFFYPLMVKQLESAQKMKELQPEMASLREKYKDDKNTLNQEMMKFMQEKKINPLGGCLPMLLQMPIWFALYRVLQNSVELYHTSFLYLPDLSARDPFGISPLVLGILMFVQQKMTPISPGMDPMQAKMMQFLPLIFAVIMFTLPSGLVVYILVNTILTITQQWFISKRSVSAGKA